MAQPSFAYLTAQEDIFLHFCSPGICYFQWQFLPQSGCQHAHHLPASITDGDYNSIQPSAFASCSHGSKQRKTSVFPTLNPKTRLLDNWLLSCLSTQLLHTIFALHFKDQGFLKPASLPWEAPRVSRQVPRHRHMTLTAVRWGTKGTLSTSLKACHSQFYPLRFACHFDTLAQTGGGSWKVVQVTVCIVFQTLTSSRSRESRTAA